MYPEHDIKNKLRMQAQGTKMDGGYMGKEKVAGKGNLFTTMGKVLLVMYILTGMLLFILAAVLYKMELSEAAVNISIIISYIVVGFVGGFIIGKIKKSRKYLWGAVMGLLYFAVLLIVSLILKKGLDSGMQHILTTLILCTASGTVGGMLS